MSHNLSYYVRFCFPLDSVNEIDSSLMRRIRGVHRQMIFLIIAYFSRVNSHVKRQTVGKQSWVHAAALVFIRMYISNSHAWQANKSRMFCSRDVSGHTEWAKCNSMARGR